MNKKVSRKEQIVSVAIDLIYEKGLENLKVSEVATRSSLKHSHVIYYFPSMDLLLKECVAYALEDLRALTMKELEKDEEPLHTLYNYALVPLNWAEKNPALFHLWMLFYSKAASSHEYLAVNNEIRKLGRKRIENLLYVLVAKNIISKKYLNLVPETCFCLQTLVSGFTIMAFTENIYPISFYKDQCIQSIMVQLEIAHDTK